MSCSKQKSTKNNHPCIKCYERMKQLGRKDILNQDTRDTPLLITRSAMGLLTTNQDFGLLFNLLEGTLSQNTLPVPYLGPTQTTG